MEMKLLKIICGIGLLAVLTSNIWSISRWHEARGVYDDVCYLRQAHLFQRFGLQGIDTNIVRDDDRYLANKLKEIGYAGWNNPDAAPCHTPIPALKKIVIQYPPGTGFVLAAFPGGFQVVPLYIPTSVVAFGFALLALLRASTIPAVLLAAVFGDAAVYLMINPTKASYSMAPTMMVCALAGFLTAKLFAGGVQWQRLSLAALIGLLIGLSVSFRLPNLFLSAGYCIFFLAAFVIARNRESFLQGLAFGIAFLIGLAPTLAAHAINAGSPFATTYGGVDVAPRELDATVLMSYLLDLQFLLLVIAAIWSALILRNNYRDSAGQAALVVAANLAVNIIFFMSHPVFTPYYTVPISMLSLWTLLFATLKPYGETAADNPVLQQPVKA
jgi:hypothetical protein